MSNLILFIIFGAIFYYISKSYSRYETYSKEAFKNMSINKESLKESELGLFVALVAKLAKADGRVDNLEAQLIGIMLDDISAVFPYPQKTKDILKEIFNEEKNRFDNLNDIALALANKTQHNKAQQQQFVGFLIQLAFVDGKVTKSEEKILQTIAEAFEFDPKIYHGIFDQFEKMMNNITPQTNIDDAYKILGVSKHDSMDTIKKAYRKLVRKYHPDIIKSQGKDEDYIKEATKKTQQINQAYEMIKKQF